MINFIGQMSTFFILYYSHYSDISSVITIKKPHIIIANRRMPIILLSMQRLNASTVRKWCALWHSALQIRQGGQDLLPGKKAACAAVGLISGRS